MARGQSDCFMLLNYFMMLLIVNMLIWSKDFGIEVMLKELKSFFILAFSYNIKRYMKTISQV